MPSIFPPVPPQLIVEPDDKYASPGASIQFTCKADGVPPPIISWFKDNQPIVPFGGLTISVRGEFVKIFICN